MNYEEIAHRFDYKNGNLFYKSKVHKQKNQIGHEVGCVNKNGYKVVRVNNKLLYVHRIVWFINYKTLPKMIDHIDGNRLNNCLSNLREANSSQNLSNSKLRKTNISGHKNVSWCKVTKNWEVQLTLNYKNNHLGKYKNLDIAAVIAELARYKYCGEFARNA